MHDPVRLNQQLKDSRQQAIRLVRAQAVSTLILTLLWMLANKHAAYSALAGGAIASAANAWFAWKVFRRGPQRRPGVELATFYVGEIEKIVLTAALFIVAFVLIRPVNILALLSVYFFVHMTPAVCNTFCRRPQEENQDVG